MKEKLSIKEQINHMKSKGILFTVIDEPEACRFISQNTYYFKIKAYAKNFPKNTDGKYVNLEFAALRELSTLDMHLRRIILSITLNVEHSIKTDLNQHLCSNDAEDGYAIVKSFRESLSYTDVKSNRYTEKLIDKYEPDYALWNYLEVISFGTLVDFYKHYYDIYDPNRKKLYPFLYAIKIMRNIAAHNNCILNNIIQKSIRPYFLLENFLRKDNAFSEKQMEKLDIPIFHDFAAMLYAFNIFNKGQQMRNHTFAELKDFVNRIKRNISLFDKHLNIKNNLLFFEKLVDFFEKQA